MRQRLPVMVTEWAVEAMVTVFGSRLCALSVAGGGVFLGGGVYGDSMRAAKSLGVSGSMMARFRGKLPQPPSGIPYRSPSGKIQTFRKSTTPVSRLILTINLATIAESLHFGRVDARDRLKQR